jgi:hypothetical protein
VVRIAHALSSETGETERLTAMIVDPEARKTRAVSGDKVNARASTIYEEVLDTCRELGWDLNVQTGNNLKDQSIDDLVDRLGNCPIYETDGEGHYLVDEHGEPILTGELTTPRFFVFRACRWTAWEMAQYRWKDYSSDAVAAEHNREERPVDRDDHQVTNLIRLCNYLRDDPAFERLPERPRPKNETARLVRNWRVRKRRQAKHEAEERGYYEHG